MGPCHGGLRQGPAPAGGFWGIAALCPGHPSKGVANTVGWGDSLALAFSGLHGSLKQANRPTLLAMAEASAGEPKESGPRSVGWTRPAECGLKTQIFVGQ